MTPALNVMTNGETVRIDKAGPTRVTMTARPVVMIHGAASRPSSWPVTPAADLWC